MHGIHDCWGQGEGQAATRAERAQKVALVPKMTAKRAEFDPTKLFLQKGSWSDAATLKLIIIDENDVSVSSEGVALVENSETVLTMCERCKDVGNVCLVPYFLSALNQSLMSLFGPKSPCTGLTTLVATLPTAEVV